MRLDYVNWVQHQIYEVLEKVIVVNVEQGSRIFPFFYIRGQILWHVVLITMPWSVESSGLRIELISHSEFLINDFVKGHISAYIRKVANEIQQARESYEVPIDVF